MARLQQRPAVLVGGSKSSSKGKIAIVGGRSRSVSTIVTSPWIHNHEDALKKRGSVQIANNASRSLSSAVEEEYQSQPRPFKKLMAGK